MKNLFFILLFLMAGTQAFPQIPVLYKANSGPQPGDVLTYYPADTANVATGASGAGQTWDYTGLVIATTPTDETYTDAGTSIPGANVVFINSAGTMKDYFRINESEYSLLAVSALGGPYMEPLWTMLYSDPQTLLTYPFSYPGSFTDEVAASYFLPQMSFYRKGTSSTTADGYGLLLLPTGTFANLLRVKIVQDTRDSAVPYNPPFPSVTYIHSEIYLWFDGFHKTPVLKIQESASTSNGTTTYTKSVAVAAGLNGIGEEEVNAVNFMVRPNPASVGTTLEFDPGRRAALEFSVLSPDGKTVRQITKGRFTSGKQIVPVDTRDLHPGLYFIRCHSPAGNSVRKLVVL